MATTSGRSKKSESIKKHKLTLKKETLKDLAAINSSLPSAGRSVSG